MSDPAPKTNPQKAQNSARSAANTDVSLTSSGNINQGGPLDPSLLTPEVIQRLQKTHGNQYVLRLLQRKAEPQKPPVSVSDDADTQVQRKLGFEFELMNWQTWKAKGFHNVRYASAAPPDMPNRRTRLPKGKPIVRGPGYELQAEDDPNNANRSNLEIVTAPFTDDQPSGRGDLRTAIRDAVQTMQNMSANYAPTYGAGNYLEATQVPGTTVENKAFFKTMNPWVLNAKVQTTFGVRLDQLSTLLKDIYLDPHEGAPAANARERGRRKMGGWDPAAGPPPAGSKVPVWGEAPSQAALGIAAYIGAVAGAGGPAAPASTPEMVSLLGLIYAYLQTGAMGVRSYPKTIGWLMARTDMANIFKMLSPAERNYYKAQNGARFLALVQSIPNLAGLNWGQSIFGVGILVPDINGTINVGGQMHHLDTSFNALLRDNWVRNIAKGKDLLTGKHFPTRSKRPELEGLGGYGKKKDKMDAAGGATMDIPIFELRSAPNMDILRWEAFADKIWLYVYLLNQGQAGGNAEKYGQVNAPF